MVFAFSEICTLLSRLEDIELQELPFLDIAAKRIELRKITDSWFKSHRGAISDLDQDHSVAFLSALLPEGRTDRVYGVQSASLCRILGRCLGLSAVRARDLQAYKQPGSGDLATCLERVLRSGGPPAQPPVSLEEVDGMLATLAGQCRFSDSKLRLPHGSSEARDEVVGNIFKRLLPYQGKWLVRLILKDFSPVRLNERSILESFHFLMPDLLRFQNCFDAAVKLVKGSLKEYPTHPDPRSQQLHRRAAASLLKPAVGIKVGRPPFIKARGIDHCLKLCEDRRWILERKYDGEYCEIHIDLSRSQKPSDCITIYSKSGKDSTEDRIGLHQTVVDCLRLDKPDCKIKRQAILLGEMVAYSDKTNHVLPFEHIRKHVNRSGRSLGIDEDSPPHYQEHLAIVFFDLLLLDDEIMMRRPVDERRTWLREVYVKIPGRAMSAEWKIVNFEDRQYAKKAVLQQFAASITERCEGLILKPCGTPFFSLEQAPTCHVNGYIKLKKDYIEGLGDEADLAVVGGSYDAQQAQTSGFTNLRWTHFHLGCLTNKENVLRFEGRPKYRIVGVIGADHCIPQPVLEAANTLGNFCAQPCNPQESPKIFDVEHLPATKLDVVFNDPFVFEVLGSGFEKPSNCNHFMLRHARVKKMHQDRSWKDCVSFQELQEQAKAARDGPVDSECQETRRWIKKLESKCRKKMKHARASTTPPSLKSLSSRGRRSIHKQRQSGSSKSLKTFTTQSRRERELDGTTLIGDSPKVLKRRRQESIDTPCPVAKRPRANARSREDLNVSEPSSAARKTDRALQEITNNAPRSLPSLASAHNERVRDELNGGLLQKLSSVERLRKLSISSISTTTTALRHFEAGRCIGTACPFANATVYANSCIANTPYIMSDLLCAHEAVVVSSLTYWDRGAFTYPPLSATVSESQAYSGMRKIVLVEAKRTRAVKQTIKRLLKLNEGKCRERVEVWDWRVLETKGCLQHGRFGEDHERELFFGSTTFDENLDKALFVSRGA